MNLFAEAPAGFLIVLAGLLGLAAVEDAWRMKISNVLVLAILLLAIGAVAAVGFETAIWENLVNMAVVLLAGTFLFSAGKMGGGDVKLLAAISLWADFGTALWLISAVFIIGGAFALLMVVRRMFLRGRRAGYRDLRIAYGVPIVIGALAVIAQQRLGLL